MLVIDDISTTDMHKQWSSNPVINRRASQESTQSTHSNHSTAQLLKEDTIDENEPYTIDGGRLSPLPVRNISQDSIDDTQPNSTTESSSESADVLRMIIRLQNRQKQHNQLIERELEMLRWKLSNQ